MKFIGIIPARYDSTRFPGKPLVLIVGKTMIQRVFEQASKSLDTVIVATDNNTIFEHVVSFGGVAVMTSKSHQSGTDRCYEAFQKYSKLTNTNFNVIINIQGDEPFINPLSINLLKECFSDNDTEIATLIKKETDSIEISSPDTAKVVIDKKGFAIYFSRSIIPFVRNSKQENWTLKHTFFKHIGIYAYRAKVLEKIINVEQSSLELSESLEQNRWLENCFKIKTAITKDDSLSVDTPEDLLKIKKLMSVT